MTDKLEMTTFDSEHLSEIFESYIPFNKLLGLRCLEIDDGSGRPSECLAHFGVRVERTYYFHN